MINNSKTIKEYLSATGLNQTEVNLQLSQTVIPTLEINSKALSGPTHTKNGQTLVTGTANALATGTTKDIYLYSLVFSMIKDATCDVPTSSVGIAAYLASTNSYQEIVSISVLTLTAQSQTVVVNFNKPIRLKTNVPLLFSVCNYTAGLMSRTCVAHYSEVESFESI